MTISDNLYKQAYHLQQEIKDAKKLIKEKESELDELILQIRQDNITGIEYAIEPKTRPIRRVQPEFIREHYPEFYSIYAHLPHQTTVSLMSDIMGGYDVLQNHIRAVRPSEFDSSCVITIEDVTKTLGDDEVQRIEAAGGIIRDEPKSYKIVALPMFMAELNRAKAQSRAAAAVGDSGNGE